MYMLQTVNLSVRAHGHVKVLTQHLVFLDEILFIFLHCDVNRTRYS